MNPPICSLCNQLMLPDPEDAGVWRCPEDASHEFYEDDGAVGSPAAEGQCGGDSTGGPTCPRCQGEMRLIAGTLGAWRCQQTPTHEFMATVLASPTRLLKVALAPVRALPYFRQLQVSMGLMGPISRAPQASNAGRGDRCLLLGGIRSGGGSKSRGRSRAKARKPRQIVSW